MDRNELLAQLRALQIAKVEINYDGQGDEGYINDIDVHDINNITLDQKNEPIKTLVKQLDGFGYDLLEQHHPGWEINEGAFGTITIDVVAGKISSNYNERYESSTESNEEW